MAIGKFKMSVRNPSTPKPGDTESEGRVYAGGTPDFDERTGLYRPGSPNEYLNPKPRNPKPRGGSRVTSPGTSRPPKSPYVRSGERGSQVRPSTPQAEKRPPKRPIGGGGSTKPTPKPLPKPGKPGRVTIMPVKPKRPLGGSRRGMGR